jgi:hypothetical protein
MPGTARHLSKLATVCQCKTQIWQRWHMANHWLRKTHLSLFLRIVTGLGTINSYSFIFHIKYRHRSSLNLCAITLQRWLPGGGKTPRPLVLQFAPPIQLHMSSLEANKRASTLGGGGSLRASLIRIPTSTTALSPDFLYSVSCRYCSALASSLRTRASGDSIGNRRTPSDYPSTCGTLDGATRSSHRPWLPTARKPLRRRMCWRPS